MSRTHYQTLIDRGRKAGLSTRELYLAIAALPVQGGIPSQADSNGYVSSVTEDGARVYRPLHDQPRV
jgi:hypothetical protein